MLLKSGGTSLPTAQHKRAGTLIRRPRVTAKTGLSRATIYRRVGDGTFPAPVRIGVRDIAWVEREVDDWIDARIAERDEARRERTA